MELFTLSHYIVICHMTYLIHHMTSFELMWFRL